MGGVSGGDINPMQIGNYEIVEQIGAGAMGVVYKVRHTRVRRNQLFALKLMHSVIADRPDLVSRFHREIEVVGRLDHPNIVSVVDAGEHQGSPYLVMEYLQGESLEKFIREQRPVAFGKKLEIMAAVCRGLDYAHNQGVVHRDIKPANIILLPDLTPKIVDFGVAHIADHTMTKTGLMVGTVSYMSPEQLNGARVDGRSDVFSTTIVLYEFLSNHLPFDGADTAAIMKKILMDAPPPLRQFVEPCPMQVEAILAKGLAKDPQYRYSALEMANGLDKLQEAELAMEAAADAVMQATVIAPAALRIEPAPQPPPPPATPLPQPAARTVPEPPPYGVVAPPAPVPNQEPIEVAPPPIPVPAAETDVAPSTHATAPLKRARRNVLLLFSGAFVVVLVVFGLVYLIGPANLRTLGSQGGWVTSVAFSPDGHYLASGGTDGRVLLWDVAAGRIEYTISGIQGGIESIAFSSDGRYFMSQSGKGQMQIWDASTIAKLHTFSSDEGSFRTAVSPDGHYVATISSNTINLLDVSTGNVVRSFKGHSDWVRDIAFSHDGRYLATGSNDATVKLWNASSGRELHTLTGVGQVWTVAFSQDTHYLASGVSNGTIKIWDVATRELLHTLSTGSDGGVECVAFSPDGRSLASATLGSPVQIWDVATGRLSRSMGSSKHSEGTVAFSPDGRYLASGGTDERVKLWDLSK